MPARGEWALRRLSVGGAVNCREGVTRCADFKHRPLSASRLLSCSANAWALGARTARALDARNEWALDARLRLLVMGPLGGDDLLEAMEGAQRMNPTEIIGPVLLIIVAIVAVAVVYFGVTAIKDRLHEREEQKRAEEIRRSRPRR